MAKITALEKLEEVRMIEQQIEFLETELYSLRKHTLFINKEPTKEQWQYTQKISQVMVGLYKMKSTLLNELAMLPPLERNVIEWYYFRGVKTWDMVAQKMHLSKQHVFTLRRNAIQQLQQLQQQKKK
ncbi:hypothetical protein C3L57_06940 [Veillonellaceae bacterium M2-8]|nr:hypothetical protein [Veillonellaceae bacterium M2-8]